MESIDRERLPEGYLNWLDSGQIGQVEYQEKVWKLKNIKELSEELYIDGKRIAFHKALNRVAQSLVNMPPISIDGGGTFDRSRLAVGFAIAEDNYDFLFIDSEGSVWAFWRSALSVSQVSFSFGVLKVTALQGKHKLEEPEVIIGKWTPVNSSTDDMDTILDMWPVYSFESSGSCIMQYVDDDEIEEDRWSAVENNLDNRLCLVVGDCSLYLEFIDQNTLSLTNAVNDLQITYERS